MGYKILINVIVKKAATEKSQQIFSVDDAISLPFGIGRPRFGFVLCLDINIYRYQIFRCAMLFNSLSASVKLSGMNSCSCLVFDDYQEFVIDFCPYINVFLLAACLDFLDFR